MMNPLHEKVFLWMENYRAQHPGFIYWLRQRNTRNAMDKGFWFQGNEDYAFVGLYNRSGGTNKTRSVGLVFWPYKDDIGLSVEIVYNLEQDNQVIDFYNKARNLIGDFNVINPTKYHKWLADENGLSEAEKFLNQYKAKLDELALQSGVSDIIIPEHKFKKNLEKIQEYRKRNNQSETNYWLFQANPENYFRIFDALTEDKLTSWLVNQYANEIKEGDKVILWIAGEKAGVYAMATVASQVNKELMPEAEADYLIDKKDNTLQNRVKLRMDYNWINNPIFKPTIQSRLTLQHLAYGRSGTNFNATQEQYNSIMEIFINNDKKKHPLNLILFGPPGTGKTYHTINKAVEIIDPSFYQKNKHDRYALTEKFQELQYNEATGDGQIAFITFHQSLSYEDFVEGIKPKMDDLVEDEVEQVNRVKSADPLGNLEYFIKPGIFKTLCAKARNTTSAAPDFDKIWKDFYARIAGSKEEVIFKSTYSELKFEKQISSENSIKVRFKKSYDVNEMEGKSVFHVGKETIRKIFNTRLDISDPKSQNWVEVRKIIGAGRASYCYAVYKSLFEFAGLDKAFNKKAVPVPHVLIIDEINRGNISQIFGELITLIEKDKRLGMDESLEVILPYSRESLSVPSNLYIIGTMNTADRSVEALDSALRRRFAFEEMPPVYHLLADDQMFGRLWDLYLDEDWDSAIWVDVETKFFSLMEGKKMVAENEYRKKLESQFDEEWYKMVNSKEVVTFEGNILKRILETINSRIEVLIDKDHSIGHSYFFNVYSLDELKKVFLHNIIPLLREYFYNDYGKIGLVLGSSFVEPIKKTVQFPKSFEYENKQDLSEGTLYTIVPADKWTLASFKSIYLD